MQADDMDEAPLNPEIPKQVGNMDDKPLSPPIAKQEDDFDDAPPCGSPKTKQADDIDDTPSNPPITKQADDKVDRPLSLPITKKNNFSAAHLNTITLKLKKLKANMLEYSMHLQQLTEEVNKFKVNMDKEHIVYKIEVILKKKSKSERNEEPKIPFSLAKSVYQRKKSRVLVQAEERLSQQDIDFQMHRNSIIAYQPKFEEFHQVLQKKLKFMEKLTPEMFCNCGRIERSKLLEQILLSARNCYLEKTCSQLYDEVIRKNNLLRVTYGFPEKPKQDDIDDIENKFHNYKRLCDKLNYIFY